MMMHVGVKCKNMNRKKPSLVSRILDISTGHTYSRICSVNIHDFWAGSNAASVHLAQNML